VTTTNCWPAGPRTKFDRSVHLPLTDLSSQSVFGSFEARFFLRLSRELTTISRNALKNGQTFSDVSESTKCECKSFN
jgi:hypothetical protein